MILIIREAPLVRELLKISHDRLLPYDNAPAKSATSSHKDARYDGAIRVER